MKRKTLQGIVFGLLTAGLVALGWVYVTMDSDPSVNTLLQCTHDNRSFNSTTGARPSLSIVFPVEVKNERTISPIGLDDPDGSRVLSPTGATVKVVLLTYGTQYLGIIRAQRTVGPSFRGIAPLDPVSVPANVKTKYGLGAQYIIAPNSCLPK